MRPNGNAVQSMGGGRQARSLTAAAVLLMLSLPNFAQISETADPQHMRYMRSIHLAEYSADACAVLDASVFEHASPSLRDLRLYDTQTGREVPYAITVSEPQDPDTVGAEVMNLKSKRRELSFDLRMPERPYTEVALQLKAHDFVAVANVVGTNDRAEAGTPLGSFTLFDLTSQHLSRDTTIRLQESRFRILRISLNFVPVKKASGLELGSGTLVSVVVPPSREAQTLYTPAAESVQKRQDGKQTLASLLLPERVPGERVSVHLAPGYTSNFSREVHVFAHPQGTSETAASESSSGTISRVHLNAGGKEINYLKLSLPVTIGANLQGPAVVQVAIENGDEPPLPLTDVRIEMRQRRLCFEVPRAGSDSLLLYYGDPAASVARYAFARTFRPSATAELVQLGPEQRNHSFRLRTEDLPIARHHSEAIWLALLAGIGVLAVFAFGFSGKLSSHR